MKTYMKADLDRYLENDWIMDMIKDSVNEEEKQIRTNHWSMDMEFMKNNKSSIYYNGRQVAYVVIRGDL